MRVEDGETVQEGEKEAVAVAEGVRVAETLGVPVLRVRVNPDALKLSDFVGV